MECNKCKRCDGPVRSKRITVDLRRDDRLCVSKNVPAGACAKCRERCFSGCGLQQLDELTQHGLTSAMTIRVPTPNYARIVRDRR